MTNAPYLLPKARSGYRMGHGEVLDHMFYDGLQSPFDGKLMGCFADATAAKYHFSRAQQDAFATESVRRAMQAVEAGEFDAEITPVTVKGRKGETVVARDETPGTCDISQIPSLKPAFGKDGTVTAASSSSISDGAAALVLDERRGRGGSRTEAPGAHARLGKPRPGAGVVHDRSGGRDPQGAAPARLEAARRRSLRDQRGVRGGHDGRDARHRHRSRARQRQRRRLRARPSDRSHRRAHPHDAAACAAPAGRPSAASPSLCIGGGEAVALAVELFSSTSEQPVP